MITLFSAHGAAEILEKDRQTLVRAMRGVRQDGEERGQKRWRMKTILAALARHQGTASIDDLDRDQKLCLADDLKTCFEQFDAGLAILLKEPDMETRRELEGKMKFGSLIGEMERLLKKANADGDIAMCLLHDEITQQTIGKFLAMMDWQIVPDKEAA